MRILRTPVSLTLPVRIPIAPEIVAEGEDLDIYEEMGPADPQAVHIVEVEKFGKYYATSKLHHTGVPYARVLWTREELTELIERAQEVLR